LPSADTASAGAGHLTVAAAEDQSAAAWRCWRLRHGHGRAVPGGSGATGPFLLRPPARASAM
jgi:hypothetical protein